MHGCLELLQLVCRSPRQTLVSTIEKLPSLPFDFGNVICTTQISSDELDASFVVSVLTPQRGSRGGFLTFSTYNLQCHPLFPQRKVWWYTGQMAIHPRFVARLCGRSAYNLAVPSSSVVPRKLFRPRNLFHQTLTAQQLSTAAKPAFRKAGWIRYVFGILTDMLPVAKCVHQRRTSKKRSCSDTRGIDGCQCSRSRAGRTSSLANPS